FFARAWDTIVRLGGREELRNRTELLSGTRGRVLEVGAGSGLNFRLYPPEVEQVVAVEPEPTMASRAAERARRADVPVKMVRATAEALPFRDETFDTVVLCLVFCSVDDPVRAASQVRRVLRPGGELRVYEHVRSASPRAARWQDRFERPWGVVGGGCHPNRDTVATLRASGFEVDVRRLPVGPPSPARPHVLGTARPA
ncbi:MAG TPA: class I SAM-dependent methyltransferase, partial [Actinomycetota bacterium]|nr:class I SAM-dependent methyltransferase [Actinomycetota bacterium]